MSPSRWLPENHWPNKGRGKKTETDVDVELDGDAAEAGQLRPDNSKRPSHQKRSNGAGSRSANSEHEHGHGDRLDSIREKLGLPGRSIFIVVGLALLILILFIIVICLGVSLSGRPVFDESHICLEPACLESSALVSFLFGVFFFYFRDWAGHILII